MRRIVGWIATTVTVLVLLFGYHTSTMGALTTAAETSVQSTGATRATAKSTPSAGTSSAPSSSVRKQTYTGDAVSTQWGPVQVQITVKRGTITKVSVLQYPHTNGHDVQINNYALPQLIQGTLDAQSAKVDMVSGATVTSVGYLNSLQSALDQASL